ncbi:glycoside hydrolase family 43 protein [Auriculariales sp. MPI-PUGE-AT-0066]|nr:glycoside hydrolase family 43 protein [Auriculariales sp. MPI-PUGE-AT-0066]
MRAFLGVVLVAVTSVAPVAAAIWRSDATFTNANPSTPGADPSVIYDEKSKLYYAYSTDGADAGWQFGIYQSPDLTTWTKVPGGAIKVANESRIWAEDWLWAPEVYYNKRTSWYFLFHAGKYNDPLKVAANFKYPDFEEASKVGVAVSRSPNGPFVNIEQRPIDYYPFDPDYNDVNLLMQPPYLLPPTTREAGESAPLGTYIPFIDPNLHFESDNEIYLFFSRNAYRNWVWDYQYSRYIEESNIYGVRLDAAWWNDPSAKIMPVVHKSFRDTHKGQPANWETSVNASFPGPTRKDGWTAVISYKMQPQVWENAHVNDNVASGGTKKNRRWAEGSTTIKRRDSSGDPVYYLTYSANNFESPDYGVGYAYSDKVLGPYVKSKSNPILSQDPSKSIYSTGHGSIVSAQGKNKELYYVHHARPSTTATRYLYTARLFVEADSLYMGFGSNAGDLRVPSGVAPYSIAAKKTAGSQWSVQVKSSGGTALDLSNPKNRLYAWVEGADAQVSVEGGKVTVTGGAAKAKLFVQYQTARWNATEPWANVTQTQQLGKSWTAVQTTLTL